MSQKKTKSKAFNPQAVDTINQTKATIRNQEAYEQLQKAQEHPLLNKKQKFIASDGEEYNLGQIHTMLQKKIEHLPLDEQMKIMKWKEMHYQAKTKVMSLMRAAYGGSASKGEGGEIVIKHPLDIKQEELKELFGRMYSLREIHEICTVKWKMKHVTIDVLKAFRLKHNSEISDKQEAFKRDYSDLRLAIKKGRLEELIWLYSKMKRKYETSNKNDEHRVLLTTLEQIRKEAEGDSLRIEGLNGNLDGLLQQHIERELQATLPLREIILSRIAANSHVPVRMFLGQLESSWYKKILEADKAEDIDFEEIKRPTAEPYDFDMISRVQAQREQNQPHQIQQANQPSVNEEELKVGNTIKEKLLERLKRQQGEVNYSKNNITMNIERESDE